MLKGSQHGATVKAKMKVAKLEQIQRLKVVDFYLGIDPMLYDTPKKRNTRRQYLQADSLERFLARGTAHKKQIKAAFIAKYGGACRCCGETESEFLALDHVNNDGAEERKLFFNETIIRRLVRAEKIDLNYQILCMNCNFSKGRFGYCPHKIKANFLTGAKNAD